MRTAEEILAEAVGKTGAHVDAEQIRQGRLCDNERAALAAIRTAQREAFEEAAEEADRWGDPQLRDAILALATRQEGEG